MTALRVLTLHYGAAPYLSVSRRINEFYCRKRGIEFVVADREPRGKRDALWSKVSRARENLAGCDLLLFLDGDAVFADHAIPPEWLTAQLPSERAMLIGEDGHPGVANTGVLLIRNNETGRAILDHWNGATDRDRSLCSRWPLDEAGFNEQTLPEFRADIELKSRRALNLVDGFINHPMGLALTAKAEALQAIAKRNGL